MASSTSTLTLAPAATVETSGFTVRLVVPWITVNEAAPAVVAAL